MLLLFLFVYSLRSLRARGCFLAFRFMPFVYPWRRRGTMRGLLGPSTLPFGHPYHCCTTCASLLTYMLIYMCYGAMSIRHSCIGLIALIRSFEHYLRVVIFYCIGYNCIQSGLLWSLPYVRVPYIFGNTIVKPHHYPVVFTTTNQRYRNTTIGIETAFPWPVSSAHLRFSNV